MTNSVPNGNSGMTRVPIISISSVESDIGTRMLGLFSEFDNTKSDSYPSTRTTKLSFVAEINSVGSDTLKVDSFTWFNPISNDFDSLSIFIAMI